MSILKQAGPTLPPVVLTLNLIFFCSESVFFQEKVPQEKAGADPGFGQAVLTPHFIFRALTPVLYPEHFSGLAEMGPIFGSDSVEATSVHPPPSRACNWNEIFHGLFPSLAISFISIDSTPMAIATV